MLYDRVDLLSPERQARRLIVFHGSATKALKAHDRFPKTSLYRSFLSDAHTELRRREVRAALVAFKDRHK